MENAKRNRAVKDSRSQFWRAFFVRTLLVAFLLIVTALVLSGYAISRYKEDYYNNVLRSCDAMALDFEAHNASFPEEDTMETYVPSSIENMTSQLGFFVYIFTEDGTCIYCSENTGQQPAEVSLSGEMLHAIQKDGAYLTDHAAGKFDRSVGEPMLIRGTSLQLLEGGVGTTYYMFASSYTRALNQFTSNMVITSVVLCVALLLVAALFNMYNLRLKARQLEQLRASLRCYAQGDYSEPLAPEQYVGTELEELAAMVETISHQASRAEASSRQFVSNVSHELRTPMTIISGFVDGVLDGTVPKNKRMEYLSIVSQEVQRLKMLVTSMLNLTKFDAGTIQLNYRLFTLNDMVFRTLLMFENRLEKRNITVEGLDSDPVRVCADPDLMGQVIYNLVENAVKFVNDGGTITFTFTKGEDAWFFAVRNTGNGISKEELPLIFERFYKSDASRSQDKTGLGLGLDITKQIVRLHHGEIRVRSEEHAYTEFEVRLPYVDPPGPEDAGEAKNG